MSVLSFEFSNSRTFGATLLLIGCVELFFVARFVKSSGATFSKIRVDVARKCCQMVKNSRTSADEEPFQYLSKVANTNNMSARSPFFFSPLSPPFSFFFRVVSRLFGVKKPRFRCRSGKNGQIFRSHLFKNPGRWCKEMLPDGEKWPYFG